MMAQTMTSEMIPPEEGDIFLIEECTRLSHVGCLLLRKVLPSEFLSELLTECGNDFAMHFEKLQEDYYNVNNSMLRELKEGIHYEAPLYVNDI